MNEHTYSEHVEVCPSSSVSYKFFFS